MAYDAPQKTGHRRTGAGRIVRLSKRRRARVQRHDWRAEAPTQRRGLSRRAVTLGVICYCVAAWAGVYKLVDWGVQAWSAGPQQYARQEQLPTPVARPTALD